MLDSFSLYSRDGFNIVFHLIRKSVPFIANYTVSNTSGYNYSISQKVYSNEKYLTLSDLTDDTLYNYSVSVDFLDGTNQGYSGSFITRKNSIFPSSYTYNVIVTTTENLLSNLIPGGINKSIGKRMTIYGNNSFQIKFGKDSQYISLSPSISYIFNDVSDCYLRTTSGTSNVTVIYDSKYNT